MAMALFEMPVSRVKTKELRMAIAFFEIPVSRVNLLQHLIYVYKITNYERKELTGSQVTIRSKISSTKGDIVNEGVEGGHSLASIRALATGGSGRLRSMQGEP